MHFSISTFDYLIVKIDDTKNIINKVEEINNFFSTISEDNNYPAIVYINYNNDSGKLVSNIYDSISYNKINSIIKKYNEIENSNCIIFNLIQLSNNNLDKYKDEQFNEMSDKFNFSNVADILDIIGTNTQFSFCDNLYMNNINKLNFYEYNSKVILEVEFV